MTIRQRAPPESTMSAIALQNSPADTDAIASLQNSFAAHKQAFFKHPFPDLRERRAHLYALADSGGSGVPTLPKLITTLIKPDKVTIIVNRPNLPLQRA